MNLDTIVEAVAHHQLDRCVRCATNLGMSRAEMFAPQLSKSARAGGVDISERAKGKGPRDGAEKEKVSRTCTPSYLLSKCRDVAHAFLQSHITQQQQPQHHHQHLQRKDSHGYGPLMVSAPPTTAGDVADQDGPPGVHSAAALSTAEMMYATKMQHVAEDVTMAPIEKIAIAKDDLSRLLSATVVEWSAVKRVLVLLASLTRMHFGEWSLDVARIEFELAIAYVALGCIDAAVEHSEESRKVLKEVRVDKGTIPQELDVIDAACYLLRAPSPNAAKALKRAQRGCGRARKFFTDNNTHQQAATKEADKEHDASFDEHDACMFPYHFLEMCAALEHGADHHDALAKLEDALQSASCEEHTLFVHIAQLAVHFKLLARADAELGAAPIAAAREKLLDEIREAKTQAELDTINERLKTDVSALEEKRRSHEALCIRQVDRIVENLSGCLQTLCSHSEEKRKQVEGLAGLVCFASARACWSAARVKEAESLMNFAADAVGTIVGASSMVHGLILLDRGMLRIGDMVHKSELSLSEQRKLCDAALQHVALASCEGGSVADHSSTKRRQHHHHHQRSAAAVKWSSLESFTGGDARQKKIKQRRHRSSSDSDESKSEEDSYSTDSYSDDDDDEDSHTSQQKLEKGVHDVEAALTVIQQHRGWYSATIASALLTLESGYKQAHRVQEELTISALICDITATVMGPTHHKTIKLLKEYGQKQKRVHPPLLSPSWGVHTLLTRVTISCNTPGADIYFTVDGDAPTEDVGVNGTMKYSGPIVLDKLGRVKIRAFSVKDGLRSGEVSAQYSVMRK